MSLLPPRPSPLAPGFKLDRYELLCPIAEGGMASVWVARHTGKHGFEKFVAIKTVLPKYASDVRFQQMFQDEARIASRIEHGNVAQILDVGEKDDITYLVMEYVDGESLSTVHRALGKKGARIPPGILLRVLADVCGGLHAAHELREDDGQLLGVVHRDVSPQNVLVSGKGVAKLIDFGIAKARDRLGADTSAGQVKGKIRYMAPEQALGTAVDRRADIWAVGAILYHLLAGKPPYDGENDVQALRVLTSGRPPVPLPATVHPAVAAVVKRSLTAAVDHRFADAAEMQQALEDAMIEAKLQTNTAAVAAFLTEHLAERAKKRKGAMGIGLKAAAERERYAETMRRSNVKGTGSFTLDGTGVGSHPGVASYPDSGPHPDANSGSGPISGSQPGHSVVTGGTLGSAAMDVGAGRPSRNRTMVLFGAGGGAALGLAVVGVMLMTRQTAPDHPDPKPAVQSPVATAITATTQATAAAAPWTASPVVTAAPPVVDPLPAVTADSGSIGAVATSRPAPAGGSPQPGPAVGYAPPRPVLRPTAPTKPNHPKTRIDDGF